MPWKELPKPVKGGWWGKERQWIADTTILTGIRTVIFRDNGRNNQEKIFRDWIKIGPNEAVGSGMLFSALLCLRNGSRISSAGATPGDYGSGWKIRMSKFGTEIRRNNSTTDLRNGKPVMIKGKHREASNRRQRWKQVAPVMGRNWTGGVKGTGKKKTERVSNGTKRVGKKEPQE
jgi:hypothetical protein